MPEDNTTEELVQEGAVIVPVFYCAWCNETVVSSDGAVCPSCVQVVPIDG